MWGCGRCACLLGPRHTLCVAPPFPCRFNRWRVFYIACSELFNYNKGEEWGVGHYVFR